MDAAPTRGRRKTKVDPRDTGPATGPTTEALPPADVRLVEQLRAGDTDAGRRLVHDYYPGVYRYLLYLTGRRELAEDLTQETFLQAWWHLDQFAGRAPLRVWLHRIAHREFLQSLRQTRSPSQQPQTDARPLEELGETAAPVAEDWREAVELRELLRKLPVEEREVLALHYLHGYSSAEIGQIVRAPAGTIRYRLSVARAKLQRELGEGDLAYLNGPSVPMRQWAWLPLDQMSALETRLRTGRCSVFGIRSSEPSVPNTEHPTPNTMSEATTEENMERREFLRHAAVGAAGLMLPETEREVIDNRLAQKVTCAFKGTALSDLCEKLKTDAGIVVSAGPSVADEKVTLFCEKLPLREVMRQLSRPFGYTWLRSGTPGKYRYELVQDLRSQLLEEELRNRDRHASLLALEKEMERYRPYLDLSPEEALARSKSAAPGEKKLLEQFAIDGWAAIQMYFRLTPQQLAILRGGQRLTFVPDPNPGELPLPPDLEQGILQCQPYRRLTRRDDGGLELLGPTRGVDWRGMSHDPPNSLPLTALPEFRARVCVNMPERELGQYAYWGSPGFSSGPGNWTWGPSGPWAIGRSPSFLEPNNALVNAKLARDPALQPRISAQVSPPDPNRPTSEDAADEAGSASRQKLTSADVLEALHQATGLPIVADYYTRLCESATISLHDQPLFEVLNRLSDAMHLRWHREGSWLQFRSTSFYFDRLKEVPNRQLERWTTSRRQHGSLTLEDLVEIAQLSDTQLDAADMAEGAREHWGLREWDLVRSYATALIREPLRALAAFTAEQRQEMLTPAGLPFARMSLAQQQQYITFALKFGTPLQSLDELAGATLRVRYTQPGWFEWRPSGPWWLRYVVPLERGKRVPLPQIKERSREAALQALRGIDLQIREAVQQALRRADPLADTASLDEAAQIAATEVDLEIIFVPDSTNQRSLSVYSARDGGLTVSTTW